MAIFDVRFEELNDNEIKIIFGKNNEFIYFDKITYKHESFEIMIDEEEGIPMLTEDIDNLIKALRKLKELI